MDDQPTCGKGLAGNASLPAAVGELMAAMAGVLDVHQRALDLTDEHARPEHHAYVTLVLELRAIAAQLSAAAERMAGYADLPMGRHDEAAIAGPEAIFAFDRFVKAQGALHRRLGALVEDHAAMLEQMRGAAPSDRG
jgi:hypothetical protein